MYLDIGFRIWEPNHHTSTVKKLILEPVSAHITGLVVIVSRVINDRRKLVLGELPELSLQLHVEGDDGENQEDHHQARHCSSQTKVLCFRKITPVALTHPLLPPVDVAVVLELLYPNQAQNSDTSTIFHTTQNITISLLYCFAPPMRQRFASRLMMDATKAGPIFSQLGLYVPCVAAEKGSLKRRKRQPPIPPTEARSSSAPRHMQ